MRKIFVVFMCLMCIICLVGCDEKELKIVKDNAKQELNDYIELLNESDYSLENWNKIKEICIEKNNLIDIQDSIDEIQRIKDDAIFEINNVAPNMISYEWIINNFDVNDEKEIWNGNLNEEYNDTIIIVTLKKTSTFPELDLSCFGLNNAIDLKYSGCVMPPDYFFQTEYNHLLDNYRQVVYIYFNPLGREQLIESIRKLEKLEFVKRVNPDYIGTGGV